MYRAKTLAGKLIALVCLALALGLAASWLVVSFDMRRHIDDVTLDDLARDANAVAAVLDTYKDRTPDGGLIPEDDLARWAKLLGVRITIIDMRGDVLADSEVPRERLGDLDNHMNRVEVKRAMAAGSGSDRRHSDTTKMPYLYYALKAEEKHSGDSTYIIRCSLPMTRYYKLLSRVRANIFFALIVAGAVTLAVGITGVRRVTRPIRKLTAASRATRRGERAHYPMGGSLEIEELSRTLKENALVQAKMVDELEGERGLLRTVVRSAPCGLLLVDAEGIVQYVNDWFAPLLRDTPDAALGMPADGALRNPELTDLIAVTREGVVDAKGIKLTLRQQGAERFYEARAVLAGVSGHAAAAGKREVLLVLNDVTERQLAEEARKSFVADAGHEFQTPLSSISVAAELLMAMGDSTGGEREPYLREILRQRERMTMLVDDLLLLSKLESGVPTEKSGRFDFAELVAVEAAETKKSARADCIEWETDLPRSVFVEGRREEIRRAVSNLLDNAVKYTYKRYGDAPGGKISVALTSGDGSCRLTVSDNGVGIPGEDAARIFGRFERVERDRARGTAKTGGYGLGLAIARTAVESHGGKIAAGTKDGLTTFTVVLPTA